MKRISATITRSIPPFLVTHHSVTDYVGSSIVGTIHDSIPFFAPLSKGLYRLWGAVAAVPLLEAKVSF